MQKAKYLLVREVAENDLLVRQCTFVHAVSYCHTRDATQRCQCSELTQSLRSTPTLVHEMAGRFFVDHSVYLSAN